MIKDKKQLIADQDLRAEKLKILEEHFPGAVEKDPETGKYHINSNELQLAIEPGKSTVDEEGYELTWVGKKLAFDEAYRPNRKLLRPLYEDSKNFDKTNNILIKGDNVDALKILRQNYFNKVKMIYIDPPYNTKSDYFIYQDDFSEKDEEILEKLDYKLEDLEYVENILGTRSHSGWLTFMYSRLLLAKDLLTDDGVIFISIDDNEKSNLQLLCNEIFGERNLVNTFVWINNLKGRQISGYGASKTYEYILAYSKNVDNNDKWFLPLNITKELPDAYRNGDYELHRDELGDYVIKNQLHNTNKKYDEITRPKLVFCIHYNPATKDIKISGINENKQFKGYVAIKPPKNQHGRYQAWRWSAEKVISSQRDLAFVKNGNTINIYTKIREHNITRAKDLITNISNGDKNLEQLKMNCFDSPKPVALVKLLLRMAAGENDIIMDFFAGSGTTAQSLMEFNAEDGGKRKFIMVQLAENIENKKEAKPALDFLQSINKPANIFEICAERIRRAGDAIKDKKVDAGFKVFELIDDEHNQIYDIPIDKLSQQELDLPQTRALHDILYSFMAADKIMLDEEINCLQEDALYVAGSRGYIFAEIELGKLDEIKRRFPQVEFLSVYSPNIASDKFMLLFEDYAVTLGFEKDKLKILG